MKYAVCWVQCGSVEDVGDAAILLVKTTGAPSPVERLARSYEAAAVIARAGLFEHAGDRRRRHCISGERAR